MACNYYEHRLTELEALLNPKFNFKETYPEFYEELITEREAILQILGAKEV